MNIIRKVRLCTVTGPGRVGKDCLELDALIDTGATTSVISPTLAR